MAPTNVVRRTQIHDAGGPNGGTKYGARVLGLSDGIRAMNPVCAFRRNKLQILKRYFRERFCRTSRLALHPAHAELLRLLLTSGNSSRRLATPLAQGQTARPPRVLRTHLHAYACRIYVTAFLASTGHCRYWPVHPAEPPLSARYSSGRRFTCGFLWVPPRDGHLAVRLTLPVAGCAEDSPLQVSAPWRAHQRQTASRLGRRLMSGLR